MKETRFAELSKDWLFRAAPEDFEHRAPTMKDVRIHLRIQHGYFYIFGESSMTVNLVVWKWSEQASDKNFRRRQKLKMSDYALALANGDDQYCGQFDFSGFVGEVEAVYPGSEVEQLYVLETHDKFLVFNMPNAVCNEVIPVVGRLAMKYGLNGCQC